MNSKALSLALIIIISVVAVLPWLWIQSQYLVNGNISWLLIAAERLVIGGNIPNHVYESNPPLSILIYIPHVLFAHLLNIKIQVGGLLLTALYAIISSLVFLRIIKALTFLTFFDQLALFSAYFISITLIQTAFFADREHIMLLAYIPFMLCMYAKTHDFKLPKALTTIVFIIGTICILVKPHYGLLPAIFFIDRAVRLRSLKVIFHPDFMTLAIGTATYILLLYTVFNDYLTVILPDTIELYAPTVEPVTALLMIQIYVIILMVALALEYLQEDLKPAQRSFVMFLYSCSFLCLIPYAVQMKGFYNHTVPIYAFFLCAFSLSLSFRLTRLLKNYQSLSPAITFISLLSMVALTSPPTTEFPKLSDLSRLPVAKFLEAECTKPCTFFAFHGDIEIINPTAAYMEYTHGTRFPSFWFLPELIKNIDDPDIPDKQHYLELKQKYTNFVIEDLKHYKPSIMLIAADIPVAHLEAFNVLEFFSDSIEFKNYIEANYRKDGQFEFDRSLYFKGTTLEKSYILKYDIYRRINQGES